MDRLMADRGDGAVAQYLPDIRVTAEELPRRLRAFLAESRITEASVFKVAGLPLSPHLAMTPVGWATAEALGAGRQEELTLLLIASVVGDPFSWATQQNGRLVHDVCPAPGAEQSLTSASSEAALSLHTEDVHHSCRADYVCLMCLRNPDATPTTVARCDDVVLSHELRDSLSERRFRFHPDDSHDGGGSVEPETGPVLFGPAERPYLRFDVDFVSGEDETGSAAIQTAARSFERAAEQVVLEPGEIVFLDNQRVLHGRSPFTPRYDGTDRWLKRVNLARDIRRTYRQTGSYSRVIARTS